MDIHLPWGRVAVLCLLAGLVVLQIASFSHQETSTSRNPSLRPECVRVLVAGTQEGEAGSKADAEHANALGDFDVDADHPCALPASPLESKPFVPDAVEEQGPATLVYPDKLPDSGDPTEVWPTIFANDMCGTQGVEMNFGSGFMRVPKHGFSTKRLPAGTAMVQLRCVGETAHSKVYVMGIMNKSPPASPVMLPPSRQRPHILMLGQDSMARSAFMRHSPVMQRLMRNASNFPDHELFDFRYYHSLQYNTNGNTNPLFGNITYVQNPFTKGMRVLGVDLDNDGMPDSFVGNSDREAYHMHKGWLWLHAKRRGYSPWWFDVTFHRPVRGLSQTNGPFKADGRRYPRALELVHPHWVDREGVHARCKCLHEDEPCVDRFCFYNRHRMDLTWQRLLDAWKRHSHKRPVFLSMWSSLAHMANQGPQVRVNDAYDGMAFEELFKTPEVRNAFVIYYSDHGVNYGATDAKAGITLNVESKRPMLFMWVPKWWLRAHPEARAALLANRKALLTHFDMYRTLLEIMDGPGSWEERRSPWQLSLFQPVPLNRTCDEAHVPPTYCTCAKWTDTTLREDQLRALERELNHDLPPECMKPLRVAEVESCSTTSLLRTHFDKVVTEAVRKDLGQIHKEFTHDVMTKVAFRLNEKGEREEAPVMLATLFETGGLMRVTQLRQLTSYGPYIACLKSAPKESQHYALLAEKCICPPGGDREASSNAAASSEPHEEQDAEHDAEHDTGEQDVDQDADVEHDAEHEVETEHGHELEEEAGEDEAEDSADNSGSQKETRRGKAGADEAGEGVEVAEGEEEEEVEEEDSPDRAAKDGDDVVGSEQADEDDQEDVEVAVAPTELEVRSESNAAGQTEAGASNSASNGVAEDGSQAVGTAATQPAATVSGSNGKAADAAVSTLGSGEAGSVRASDDAEVRGGGAVARADDVVARASTPPADGERASSDSPMVPPFGAAGAASFEPVAGRTIPADQMQQQQVSVDGKPSGEDEGPMQLGRPAQVADIAQQADAAVPAILPAGSDAGRPADARTAQDGSTQLPVDQLVAGEWGRAAIPSQPSPVVGGLDAAGAGAAIPQSGDASPGGVATVLMDALERFWHGDAKSSVGRADEAVSVNRQHAGAVAEQRAQVDRAVVEHAGVGAVVAEAASAHGGRTPFADGVGSEFAADMTALRRLEEGVRGGDGASSAAVKVAGA